ncbi:hypothetical protein A2316_01230 [Candidatus Falkowbacteria bacterium RIFOXYB2_FULL_38_15]|uniref:Uncharacterized protein n=1 Tax=Candidatus Falkowbacteria bacterium RIFOXYA2_FULL_38_12 TaxID=1797993 RepID=A0A1F5S534_9BACT|nr:MAG: hypothetical protein A2257_02630 [Candidatus Falkowbacteria bacterium RIFOXYA2_FULL_38_12]OGF32803.1 MAG: hypothetical protein A2316_01230 [Candidatus Falkowbacteria bacterium RIFOXYB2_FULL_38_15]OGF42159.1 MAG: hypothetical protein A2555_02655 [Candidatus Falkowbacteria bacterium RIFOXYD2_FULL_39_16]
MFLNVKKNILFINIFTALFLAIFLLPSEVGATPDGCVQEGDDISSCCGTNTERDLGAASHPGWSCQNTESRTDGNAGCAANLCPGGVANMCCPPASGEATAEGSAGNGSGVRGSLETAAREAHISTSGSVSGIIQRVISTVLGFVGVIFLVLIIVGGLMWMTAGGNEDQVGKSKKLITNAVIGTIIIMLAYVLVSFVMGKIVG